MSHWKPCGDHAASGRQQPSDLAGPVRNRVLAGLAPAQRRAFEPFIEKTQLKAGQVLCTPDAAARRVWFPASAVLALTPVLKDGRGVDAATFGCESVVGVVPALARMNVHTAVVVRIAGEAYSVSASRFYEVVLPDSALLETFLSYAQSNMAQSEQWAACNAVHTAGERLARWLLVTQDRAGVETLAVTQDYLANIIGVQRTTITLLAHSMKMRGVIGYSRGKIQILERDRLIDLACECYEPPAESETHSARDRLGVMRTQARSQLVSP